MAIPFCGNNLVGFRREMNQLAISLKNVAVTVNEHPLFDGLSVDIPKGKITALMGPSGVGKTSLMRLFSGQLQPSSGSIVVLDKELGGLSLRELSRLRRSFGYLFQDGALFSDLNVFENVAFGLREHTDLSEEMIRDHVLMRLNAVGLRGARDLAVSDLSGGMARRVAIARAISMDPEIIFYDEPFAGQDPINTGILRRLIQMLNHSLGITSVIVSHEMSQVAAIADKVYVLADGGVVSSGSPEEIFESDNAQVQQFVSGLPDGPIAFEYQSKPVREDFLDG